ncbi:MAG: hypothetical protein H6737_02205 [Alphaproteobacteria bacterium]|nr:hypothetical protein [Alphaproteobacteria bacterium]
MKLHEVVAIRKGVKSRTYSELSELFKKAQKADLYSGMTREFQPLDDDGETFPPESRSVQLVAGDVLKRVRKLRTKFLDIEATQELGNLEAKADVEVDGRVILKDMPATLLIFLEKELSDLHTFVSQMPTLDESRPWTKDPNSNLYRSDTARTHKTKKVQRPIVLYDATEEHPAQTQLITEDVTIGHWSTVYTSGALPVPRKDELLERIDVLRDAVKRARSRANDTEVGEKSIGDAIFGYLFS